MTSTAQDGAQFLIQQGDDALAQFTHVPISEGAVGSCIGQVEGQALFALADLLSAIDIE